MKSEEWRGEILSDLWWRWRDSTLARTTRSVSRGSNSPPDCYSLPLRFESALVRIRTTFVAFSLVEMKGFEPLTPCLQGRCSPSWATPPWVGSLIFLRWFPGRLLSPRCQHWAIFPCGRPQSIFTTAELNFRVRNGNGWTLCVCNTDSSSLSKNISLFSENWTTNSFPLYLVHRLRYKSFDL